MERTKSKQKKPAVLVIDPSIRGFGYVIMEGNNILCQNCIKTEPAGKKLRVRKGDDRIRRLEEIAAPLKRDLEKFEIVLIISELPHGSQSAIAAITLGLVIGMVFSMGFFLELGVEWYSEGDAKKAVLNKQSCTKKEMIDAIDELYDVDWYNTGYKDEAVADALAVHYVAKQQSSALKLLR